MSEENNKPVENGFVTERPRQYRDLATVESQRNDLSAEEFPEGPYGADLLTESLGKSSPWRRDQRTQSAFTYENRLLHEGVDRGGYPGQHDTHDDPAADE
ncbi:hypothetical protein PV433_27465 [Paenibacillus sp. GYB004]|uniref:hypothetical protein n=1 Tax=Paenibacillus sp. GYB004 TaxID=2994393 RepID=UPI002F967866